MTLLLGNSQPSNIPVKTHGVGILKEVIFFGEYEIPMDDFLSAVEYVLTNTDLIANDQRLQFVERVKLIQIVKGYMEGQKRLVISDSK